MEALGAIGIAGVVGVICFTLIGVVLGALYALHTSTGGEVRKNNGSLHTAQ